MTSQMTSRGVMGSSVNGSQDSAAQWESNWRQDVTHQLHESGQAHQQTAIILERLGNRLDEHDRRIGALESQPDRTRTAITQYGGCSSQLVMMAFIAFDAIVGLGGLITAVVSLILHH